MIALEFEAKAFERNYLVSAPLIEQPPSLGVSGVSYLITFLATSQPSLNNTEASREQKQHNLVKLFVEQISDIAVFGNLANLNELFSNCVEGLSSMGVQRSDFTTEMLQVLLDVAG